MIIPITWTQQRAIPNLAELREKVHRYGGSIIQYQRNFSVLIYSQSFSVCEWVPPNRSRRKAGLKHAAFSFALGWWSIFGIFSTPAIIINNLRGGIDLTRLLTEPPPLPGQPIDSTALQELRQAEQRNQWVYLCFLLSLLFVIGIWLFFYVREHL